MDVTGEASYRSDPSATVAVPVVPGTGASADQGRLFHDPVVYPSFPDTDRLPAVSRGPVNARRYGPPRWLRFTLALVVVGIVAAGAALAVVKSGVLNHSTTPAATGQTHATNAPATTKPTKDLLTPATTFAGTGSASYTIPVSAFGVTVTAGPGRSWVSIEVIGQAPIFEGILEPNTSQHEILLGPAEVDLGAGGTTVTVTSNHRSQTLLPPSAPFSYQITPGL